MRFAPFRCRRCGNDETLAAIGLMRDKTGSFEVLLAG
jgi:hypothetical protein